MDKPVGPALDSIGGGQDSGGTKGSLCPSPGQIPEVQNLSVVLQVRFLFSFSTTERNADRLLSLFEVDMTVS